MSTAHVVLLSEDGDATGTAPKATVHTADTPLHLAFSCYLRDGEGRVLLTRRALAKRTWPGVWTNSCCGHPLPGEEMADAVRRHVRAELGAGLTDLQLVLPDFRYRAVDASGVVENEVCPVFAAVVDGPLRPDPAEVAEHRWLTVPEVADAVQAAGWALSPWMREQVEAMRAAGVGPDGVSALAGAAR
jgi:isopentenyl-diphosphate Delta-isomerase